MLKKVFMFGTPPPPIGGVTKSVANYSNALQSNGIIVRFLKFRSLFHRYDLAHIHYYYPYKRLIAALIGQIIAKKTIFTIHGNHFKESSFLNILTLKIADGVILLNETILEQKKHIFEKHKIKYTIMTSLLEDGIRNNKAQDKYFKRQNGYEYLLIYAYDKYLFHGRDCYGFDLILDNIDKLSKKYKIVLLDPKAKYKAEIESISSDAIVYLPKTVNFISLLQDVDIYIRPTQTDGRSVAILEALSMNIPVLASDVIRRLPQVLTYKNNNFDDFYLKLSSISRAPIHISLSKLNDYLNFFEQL